MSDFRYFPRFPESARLDAGNCAYCGASPTIPGGRLAPRVAACAECVRSGRAQQPVPRWIQQALAHAVAASHSDWSQERQAAWGAQRVAELAATPPIAWLQNNEWPVCQDDFAVFAGELSQARLLETHRSPERSRAALRDIVQAARPDWELDAEDVAALWEQLGNFVAIYVFRCPAKQEDIYVLQTA